MVDLPSPSGRDPKPRVIANGDRRGGGAPAPPDDDAAAALLLPRADGADGEVDTELLHDARGGVRGELSRIVTIALPLMFQNTFGYLITVLSIAFVGHLGKQVLSSVVLATSIYNVTGLSIVIGLSAGMETLCGQAFGAGNYKVLGLVLQRATLVCLTASVPVVALWLNVDPLLLMLHQSPPVAAGAARYLRLMVPTIVATCGASTLNRYLVAQRVTLPSTLCMAASAFMCPIWNWLLIFHLGLGIDGAAYAAALSQSTYTLLLGAYVVWRDAKMARDGAKEATWPGLRIGRALAPAAVWQYLGYGGAAAAMICLEWWAFEVIIILSGTVKDNPDIAVSVMGITFNICAVLYMLPMSFGTAANTRIANELGAGFPNAACFAYRVTLAVVFAMQLCFACGAWLLRFQLAAIFTSDPDVIAATMHVMPVVSTAIVGDGLNALFSGVLRGCGRQGLGAYLNLAGWWGVVVPLGVLLGMHYEMGPWGFNAALAVGTTMQACIFVAVISRLDWRVEVERARALLHTHSPSEDVHRRSSLDCSAGLLLSGGPVRSGSLDVPLMRSAETRSGDRNA